MKIWDVPVCGVRQNLTQARKTLIGHSRRVGLIEWHPTAKDLLLSSAYDYKVCSLIGPLSTSRGLSSSVAISPSLYLSKLKDISNNQVHCQDVNNLNKLKITMSHNNNTL